MSKKSSKNRNDSKRFMNADSGIFVGKENEWELTNAGVLLLNKLGINPDKKGENK